MQKVEAWARYVKENPGKWRKQHTQLIDAQLIKAQRFYKKLATTPHGLEKIRKIRKT